jgi:hypothetical protein
MVKKDKYENVLGAYKKIIKVIVSIIQINLIEI